MIGHCYNGQNVFTEFHGYVVLQNGEESRNGRSRAVGNVTDSVNEGLSNHGDHEEQEQSQFDSQEMEALVDGNKYVASKTLKYHRGKFHCNTKKHNDLMIFLARNITMPAFMLYEVHLDRAGILFQLFSISYALPK